MITENNIEKMIDLITESQVDIVASVILTDTVEHADLHFSGFAQDVFDIWKRSSDKKAVEDLFYEFTDFEFGEFLEKCLKETANITYVVHPVHGVDFYTDDLKEAEEAFFRMCETCKYVELLYGKPGHYKTLKQSW